MTVEDPIEYDLDGIGQTQVNPRIELTFARALRAILRQDPDVVMIGEIRDLETAQIAVQASLTGHLVLATLHTNDAAGAVDAPGRHGRSSRSCSPRACSACSPSAWCAGSARRAGARTSRTPPSRLCLRTATVTARTRCTPRPAARPALHRLPGPQRHLRVAHDRRRVAAPHPRPRRRGRPARSRARARHDDACARTACAG